MTSVLARVAAASDARIREFAGLIPALARVPPGADRVDHFGQAVSLTGEECLRALENDNHEQFQALFPLYFTGCIAVAEQIRNERDRWPEDTLLSLYSEALMDLMAISGYALVFAQLRRDHRSWTFVRHVWSRYLQGTAGSSRKDALLALYDYTRHRFGVITPRSIIRSSWQQRMDRALAAAVPRRTVVHHQFIPDERPVHASPLIRALWPRMMMGSFYDGQDVFVSCYLRRGRPRPDSDHLYESIELARKHPEEAE